MAKYSRHDNRNKKRNKHKNLVKYGFEGKMHYDSKRKPKYKLDLSVSSYQ